MEGEGGRGWRGRVQVGGGEGGSLRIVLINNCTDMTLYGHADPILP